MKNVEGTSWLYQIVGWTGQNRIDLLDTKQQINQDP